MDLVKAEDSYADRRQLFKNIWDTASNLDDKDADITNKPRVIKTQRLDEEDRIVVDKKNKKLKLKNLRTVCNKLLDFCEKQEANNAINEKVKTYRVIKKVKKYKIKKKAKKSRSLSSPTENLTQVKATSEKIETVAISSERKEELSASSEKEGNSCDDISKPSRDCSPSAHSPVHTIRNPSRSQRNSSAHSKHSAHRKTKRSTKERKKSHKNLVNSSGPTEPFNAASAVVTSNTTKQLQLHKIEIA